MAADPQRSYSSFAKLLHWSMAIIIAVVWTLGFTGSNAQPGPGSIKGLLINSHKAIAAAVLVLALVRLLWRATHPAPPLTATSPVMSFAARAGHVLLYAAMIAVPLTGWAMTSAAGRPVLLLGMFELPALLPADAAMKTTLAVVHRLLAWCIAVLVIGHIGFALKHHFVDKDGVLRAMLPHSCNSKNRASPSGEPSARSRN